MLAAAVLYVGLGLYAWDRTHAEPWLGPGSYLGDAVYHALPSLVPVALVVHAAAPRRLLGVVLVLLAWWIADGAGYGPMRAG